MKIKILTLNLYRYYADWNNRKPRIIQYIREQDPDIVLFQECFDDGRYNGPNQDQATQLNTVLGYDTCIYHIAEMLRTERKMLLHTSVFDGLGCLSKFSVIESQALRLKQHEGDDHFRIVQRLVFDIAGEEVVLFNVHYSNKDNWARWQFEETLEFAKKEKTLPIIVGDLNIKITSDVVGVGKSDYFISWVEKKYFSYPTKNETLDYALIPKSMRFNSIICDKDRLSDHRPLVVEVELNE